MTPRKIAVWAVATAVGMWIAISIGNSSSPSNGARKAKSDDDYRYEAMAVVADQALDPDSVKFKDVFVTHHNDGSVNVCGEVNGNNAFGGKTGFHEFIWGNKGSKHEGVTLYDPKNPVPGLNAWSEGCLISGDMERKIAKDHAKNVEKVPDGSVNIRNETVPIPQDGTDLKRVGMARMPDAPDPDELNADNLTASGAIKR